MSQCIAEDRDIARKFPSALYVYPKFPEEPPFRSAKKRYRAHDTPKDKVVSEYRKELDGTIFRLLVTAQSHVQFTELRRELFPRFVELSNIIYTLIVLPSEDLDALVTAAFDHVGQNFAEDNWLLLRLDGAKDEARFCLETLHRAHFLVEDVRAALRGGSLPPESLNNYGEAIYHEWWSILHLRCIVFAISHKVAPTNEVLQCLLEGFRHSVLAYAKARSAIDPKYSNEYASIDFSSLTPDDGDYDAHENPFGA